MSALPSASVLTPSGRDADSWKLNAYLDHTCIYFVINSLLHFISDLAIHNNQIAYSTSVGKVILWIVDPY